ncbi:MAG TPA: molybdenum cofactor guanylyltransferase MobA [Acetobacteraceae bacterium]|nr:molybdenum cofactor guanylyltransferase MobA [Acetobacteraceae bacterium]
MRIAGVILAGGRASRLGGGDKPLLHVGAATMLARIIATLQSETDALAVNANGDPARFAVFNLPVLADGAFAGQGPLAGVLAGLDWAVTIGAGALLTVPGDTPFVPQGLAAALTPPPACAASNGHVHHLVALWPVPCREDLRRLLAAPGPRAVLRFAQQIRMRTVDFPVGKWDPFLNVNTGEDLAMARALAPPSERGMA